MAPKKKPQPLYVSLRLIEEERANVAKRTQARIATLFQQTDKSVDKATHVVTRIPSERIGTHVQDMCVKTNAHTRMWSRVEIEKCFRFLVTL